MAKTILTIDGFFPDATKLRGHFEERFADPRQANGERFVWDWWHVPEQYTALRTPAYHFFPPKLYEAFHNHLVWWGRRNLGCHDVSPPWMSCYIDGCRQEMHGDLPHGPWAFVYSLTPWKTRKFRGGETIILKDEILSYWSGFQSGRSVERDDVLTSVPALFNRLTVFDPRVPHGVREVEGVRDVLDGRLVIHGWFVQPRPFIEGPLKESEVQGLIDDLSGSLQTLFEEGLRIQGVLSLRMQVEPDGGVSEVKVLTDVLRHPERNQQIERALVSHIKKLLRQTRFRKSRGKTSITLPLIFE